MIKMHCHNKSWYILCKCKPFIALDGCFVKLAAGAQVLAIIGTDSDHNLSPFAFAMVRKEEAETWT